MVTVQTGCVAVVTLKPLPLCALMLLPLLQPKTFNTPPYYTRSPALPLTPYLPYIRYAVP